MLMIAGVLIGALYGGWRAKSRKGRTADVLQYAVVHAMLFGLIGLFVTLILDRTLI
ncbi:hypothetical protein OB2597_02312 [Pseudooceanicola batsensis HTCC2597]|uniref:Uncharacterized protein n=1 Tax=Pseudooceanicola batsensis (strain ATCC BAA-863 / DSM 15984 / KCTC 12145 / HTCC2597) TaxID=252305 RepID=A3TX56_PSEBH|nr:hypothetical protein [Pseudooceanicola batsensis]EAQ03416.1 hypothetical protein OB2597_02312 [Pseudooceanicola batsensis HTCC2597]